MQRKLIISHLDNYLKSRNNNLLPTILFISLLSSPSWSETYLEKRNDGLCYEDKPVWDETDIPYTGEVSGRRVNYLLEGEINGIRLGNYICLF